MGCLLSLGLAGCTQRRYREVVIPVALSSGDAPWAQSFVSTQSVPETFPGRWIA
jgi:hypothetical protein